MAQSILKVDVESDNAFDCSKLASFDVTLSWLLCCYVGPTKRRPDPSLELTHSKGGPLAVGSRKDTQVPALWRYRNTRIIERPTEPYCTSVSDPGCIYLTPDLR